MFVPATLPSGDVTLDRACRFIDLYSQVVRGVAVEAAEDAEPAVDPEVVKAPKPVTLAAPADNRKPLNRGIITLDINRALMQPGMAARFATVILVHDDGREVTEEEAAGPDFEFGPFAQAWSVFQRRYDEMTSAQMGLLRASTSPGDKGATDVATTSPAS